MWYVWIALTLVTCARCETAVGAGAGAGVEAAVTRGASDTTTEATTHSPPRTLDRQAAELAWRTWLQSPESRDPNAPPRRITTKSLFITPLVCPKGQRLDRDGCVQVVTLNKDEHERYLLEQLNALFTSAPGNTDYDYGEEEPGPLQLSIPLALEPQAAPLQGPESLAQLQEHRPNVVQFGYPQGNIEAELELLKLEHAENNKNILSNLNNHNILNNLLPSSEKPKRDSSTLNTTSEETAKNVTDEGQKELVFGKVSIDPVLYLTEYQNHSNDTKVTLTKYVNNETLIKTNNETQSILNKVDIQNNTSSNVSNNENNGDNTKLNPENDYSDIGEAIKLISRYAEVTTDDNFDKEQKRFNEMEDGILGTRTKLQHRRNKFKPSAPVPNQHYSEYVQNANYGKMGPENFYIPHVNYYRYPWLSEHSPTPPPDYPFKHLQDYWPGRRPTGGVYNFGHENPRRHHHSYLHNNMRPHNYEEYARNAPLYPRYSNYPGQHNINNNFHKVVQRRVNQGHPQDNNQDLYSLLGLRHWFTSEGSAKR